jgi:hypothetical protein
VCKQVTVCPGHIWTTLYIFWAYVCSRLFRMQSACAMLYCFVWFAVLISSHYLISGTIFGKKLLLIKSVIWCSLQLSSETFYILRRIKWDIIINGRGSSCKVHVFLVIFWSDLNFLERLYKNRQISNFIQIHRVGAECGRTDMKIIVAFRSAANAPKKCKNGVACKCMTFVQNLMKILPFCWSVLGLHTPVRNGTIIVSIL